ncbi:MAG TPA: universal stress protein [Acidimicrobiia bacterium]|nr:universal stress protein [Acidimicrobiia bacterium]
MHVLVATTGVLPPTAVADLCDLIVPPESGTVTVMTVVQVPRTFLASLDHEERRSLLDDDFRREEQSEAKAARYLEERGRRVVNPLVAALAVRGRAAAVKLVEGDDPAEAIIGTARTELADLIVMGATRRLFTEQAWTSVSARVMEMTQCPLVLVPGLRSEDTGEIPRIEA